MREDEEEDAPACAESAANGGTPALAGSAYGTVALGAEIGATADVDAEDDRSAGEPGREAEETGEAVRACQLSWGPPWKYGSDCVGLCRREEDVDSEPSLGMVRIA